VLATTSEADALVGREALAIVTLPAPVAARRAGLSDAERRQLVRTALGGVIDGFGPDLIAVDTFPSGPHGELAGVKTDRHTRRALIRRSVPDATADALTAGLGDYDLAILAGDPEPLIVELPIAVRHVPPITSIEASCLADRATARRLLGLPDGRLILVAAGGGGDLVGMERARVIAEAVVRVAPELTPVLAVGPLARDWSPRPEPKIRTLRTAALASLLAAFDGAFAPAGYNTAHELAKARVPAALSAQPRPFDDQAARAARFEKAGFARALTTTSDDAVAEAIAWMATARIPELEAGGADRAAEALLDLVTGGRR